MPTTTKTDTLEETLRRADPDVLADALRKMDLALMFTPRKVTFAAMTSAAAQNITSTANFSKATVAPAFSTVRTTLPPILQVITLRVTAGTLAVGPAIVTDAGGTATAIGAGSAHVALLSDDGTTLTFQAAVTGMVLEYIPRSSIDMTTKFAV